MSVQIPMPDKTMAQVPTIEEHNAVKRRLATLEESVSRLERAALPGNQRGPTDAQIAAGPALTPHATPAVPPLATTPGRPAPPRAPGT